MNDSTKNIFLAMIAAQPTAQPIINKEVKEVDTKQQEAQEWESVDISDIFKKTPTIIFDIPKVEPAPTAPRLEVVKYTDLSFLVKGEDTFLIREELKGLGGIFRHKWNAHGPAWMFSAKKREEIETFLGQIM
jgi:hypothetical protein